MTDAQKKDLIRLYMRDIDGMEQRCAFLQTRIDELAASICQDDDDPENDLELNFDPSHN